MSNHPVAQGGALARYEQSRRTVRKLVKLQEDTRVRHAEIRAFGMEQQDKVRELHDLCDVSLIEDKRTEELADMLANHDVVDADRQRYIINLARVGTGEIIAETISVFAHWSRP